MIVRDRQKPRLSWNRARLQGEFDLRVEEQLANSPISHEGQAAATIRAELTGAGSCKACGITARSNTPVLKLCRLLVAAGEDPASPLEAWRGGVLCITVCSIGQGAQLTVDESRVRFARWKPFSSAAVSPLIAPKNEAATLPAERAP